MMNMIEDSQHGGGMGGIKVEPMETDNQQEDTVGVSLETIKVENEFFMKFPVDPSITHYIYFFTRE